MGLLYIGQHKKCKIVIGGEMIQGTLQFVRMLGFWFCELVLFSHVILHLTHKGNGTQPWWEEWWGGSINQTSLIKRFSYKISTKFQQVLYRLKMILDIPPTLPQI